MKGTIFDNETEELSFLRQWYQCSKDEVNDNLSFQTLILAITFHLFKIYPRGVLFV
jgi:hypothetical protein